LARVYDARDSDFLKTVKSGRAELNGLTVAQINWKKGDSLVMDEF